MLNLPEPNTFETTTKSSERLHCSMRNRDTLESCTCMLMLSEMMVGIRVEKSDDQCILTTVVVGMQRIPSQPGSHCYVGQGGIRIPGKEWI